MPQRDNDRRYLTVIALVAALYWSIAAIDLNVPQWHAFALLVIGALLLFATLRGIRTVEATLVYAVAWAMSERLGRERFPGSDVLPATREAIDVFLAGGNPYAHVMQSTFPIGSPFVYPPGEFFFYLPWYRLTGDIFGVEPWSGVLIVVCIALIGLRAGFHAVVLPAMLYAIWGIAAFRTSDGGNDVSASLLVVIALAALAFVDARRGWRDPAFLLSAVAFGWALAFKQFALLVAPPLLRHLALSGADWRRYALVAGGVAAAFVLPFLARDPIAFIGQQVQVLTFHQAVWGVNVLHVLYQRMDVDHLLPFFFIAEIALTLAAVAISAASAQRTLGTAALTSAAVLLVPLLLARWTTQSYYVYVGAVVAVGIALLDVPVSGRSTPHPSAAPTPSLRTPRRSTGT